MTGHYSAFNLVKHALGRNLGWDRAWRDAAPKPAYDVIIIGGGGHGLATAYYLAKNHGVSNVAVLERGYIGGGNTGRNTTIVRSNYMIDGNTRFYEWSLKLWEGLSRDLNYNVMFSQRGQLNLCHSPPQLDAAARRGNVMRLNGIDAELLSREDVRRLVPILDFSDQARFPIHGALWQARAGTRRIRPPAMARRCGSGCSTKARGWISLSMDPRRWALFVSRKDTWPAPSSMAVRHSQILGSTGWQARRSPSSAAR